MTDTLRDQLLGLGFKPAPKPERHEKTDRPSHAPRGGKPGGEPRQRRPEHARDRSDAPGAARPAGAVQRNAGSDRRGPQHQHAGRPRDGNPPAPGAPALRRDGGASRPAAAGAAQARSPRPSSARNREDIDLAKAYAIRAQREKDERIAAEKAKQEDARLRREAKLKLAVLLKDQGLNDPAADIARHFDYGGKIKRIHVTADQLKALNAGQLGVVQLDGRYLLVSAALLAQAQDVFAPAVALRIDPDAPADSDPYADPQFQVPDDLVW